MISGTRVWQGREKKKSVLGFGEIGYTRRGREEQKDNEWDGYEVGNAQGGIVSFLGGQVV